MGLFKFLKNLKIRPLTKKIQPYHSGVFVIDHRVKWMKLCQERVLSCCKASDTNSFCGLRKMIEKSLGSNGCGLRSVAQCLCCFQEVIRSVRECSVHSVIDFFFFLKRILLNAFKKPFSLLKI